MLKVKIFYLLDDFCDLINQWLKIMLFKIRVVDILTLFMSIIFFRPHLLKVKKTIQGCLPLLKFNDEEQSCNYTLSPLIIMES